MEEREEDKYEHVTTVKCWKCDPSDGSKVTNALNDPKVRSSHSSLYYPVLQSTNLQVKALVDGVMHSMSSARQSEVQAWEEEILPCEHTLTLQQLETGPIPASGNKSALRRVHLEV